MPCQQEKVDYTALEKEIDSKELSYGKQQKATEEQEEKIMILLSGYLYLHRIECLKWMVVEVLFVFCKMVSPLQSLHTAFRDGKTIFLSPLLIIVVNRCGAAAKWETRKIVIRKTRFSNSQTLCSVPFVVGC